jgi:hypothetical protein
VSKTKTSGLSLEVARLANLVEEQQRLIDEQRNRLEALEVRGSRAGETNGNGSGNGQGNGESRHSRRELLRLGGLAAAGAAGAAGLTALQALPAAAANGANVIIGQANDGTASTVLNPSSATPTAVEGLLKVDGSITSGATPNLAVNATANFFRAVRGIAPNTPANGPSGVGVWGSSDAGAGVVGSSATGVDVWSFNSGRFLQASQPAGPPTYQGGVYDTTITPNAWTDFELVRDGNGIVWVFLPPSVNGANVAPGAAPGGTWIPLQPGGAGGIGATGVPDSRGALFTVATTKLLGNQGSDGATFLDMMPDATQGLTGGPDLVMTIVPSFNCLAILTLNADLYTNIAGINQDIGIFVSPSSAPQNIVAWKESGGAVANGPNAAFLQTIYPLTRGTAYTVRAKWKANQATNATIRAGAGPFPAGSGLGNVSPTRLTAQLIVNP